MAIKDEDFEALVRAHQAMLYRIAFNFFLSIPVAEEIVQDVFVQCHQNLQRIESPAHLKAWLRRAATHRCIDLLRSSAAQREIAMEELPDVIDGRDESDPLLSAMLRRLVASLPEQQRLIIILRFSEDMTSDEIGTALNMPASTVRNYLQRALAALREKAQHAFGEETCGRIRKQSS